MTIHPTPNDDSAATVASPAKTPPETPVFHAGPESGAGVSLVSRASADRRTAVAGPAGPRHGDAIMIDAVLVHVAAVAAGARGPASWDPNRDARTPVRAQVRKRYPRSSYLPTP